MIDKDFREFMFKIGIDPESRAEVKIIKRYVKNPICPICEIKTIIITHD